MSWLNKSLPTASALQINTPSYPVPAEGDGKPVSYPYGLYVVLSQVTTRVQVYTRISCSPEA